MRYFPLTYAIMWYNVSVKFLLLHHNYNVWYIEDKLTLDVSDSPLVEAQFVEGKHEYGGCLASTGADDDFVLSSGANGVPTVRKEFNDGLCIACCTSSLRSPCK